MCVGSKTSFCIVLLVLQMQIYGSWVSNVFTTILHSVILDLIKSLCVFTRLLHSMYRNLV